MNLISRYKMQVVRQLENHFNLDADRLAAVELKLNVDKGAAFGDVTCNAAMVLAKVIGKNPRELAVEIKALLEQPVDADSALVDRVEIAGPGFLNIFFTHAAWARIACDLFMRERDNFVLSAEHKRMRYLLEYVSANPTGPLHFGHGRNGIIGDSLARILSFLGHEVTREFYINDAGKQVQLLGASLKARCLQAAGKDVALPEGGYAGDYLVELAQSCIQQFGAGVVEKDDQFFSAYAKEHLLALIKEDLKAYGIEFDRWFSEKSLHDNGSVERSLDLLKDAGLLYEQEGAYWFKSSEFGDDKDRVIKKANGELTYIAADIAYHKDKFDRGYDKIIDILGQDHHGYVKRLKATMQALGYDAQKLDVILYQLVSLKENEELVRMSKRAGTFTKLSDVIDAVGADVTRFFFLNRKADAHLEFDLGVAMKKSDENPVFYIHYAYVRTKSLLVRAAEHESFSSFIDLLERKDQALCGSILSRMGEAEHALLKRILFLADVLQNVAHNYQTHVLSYYTWELAYAFHTYYTNNRVIDPEDQSTSQVRIFMVHVVQKTLDLCLDLLGLSKPERM
ncbi:MAG: Arginine-tRNA ligase [candidate division TM6 bacterium GW2011_GWF2_38_10]|nr:MAG: Arginine-tRNA ligase [candidate division TM6 bacterium GW2011_GWF2_38_10]